MAEITLAIDFGSSNTFISRKDVGLVLKEPTLICASVSDDGYVIKALGQEAKEMQGKTDEQTVIFSPISQGEIKSFEYASLLLRNFINKSIGKKGLFDRLKILICVPTGITEESKQAYVNVCKSVGAKTVIAVPKIICSAYGAGVNIGANNAQFVIDIGGGTIDSAVINLSSIIEGSTLALGGRAMDTAISELVKNKYGVEIGILTANKVKESIGSLFDGDNASMEVCGIDLVSKLPVNLPIFASDIQEAIAPFLDEIIRVIETTINILPPEISGDVCRNGLVICGGFSKIAGIVKFFRSVFNLPVTVIDTSENTCIIGASKLINHDDVLEKVLLEL